MKNLRYDEENKNGNNRREFLKKGVFAGVGLAASSMAFAGSGKGAGSSNQHAVKNS